MKKIIATVLALVAVMAGKATTYTIMVSDTRLQTVTGFGGACCDGAMCPFGSDTNPVKLLYGKESKIGLNIMRMEISPNFVGDVVVPEWGNWDTPYDWKGSLPSAKIVKQRGGIVFGTPWSPPGEYKTNGTAQGGNADDQGNKEGRLRKDCYEKFFPWLNTFLKYMKQNGVNVDAVSIQNEPDWWVSYSGCLYTPEEQLDLVKNYAHMLDRETYKGVRLISAEPLGFDPKYSNKLMNDATARDQIDIIAGHIYGHPPLVNMKNAAILAEKYGKEVWMTEHSVTDNIDHLPNWEEQLTFAKELNECMNAGCTGYIYWYMRAHWAFVGTGEAVEINGKKINIAGNTKNKLLPRAFVMSHFSKHVTGATRLKISGVSSSATDAAIQASAYIKGDSLILMAINATKGEHNIKLSLPVKVESGIHLLSTGNETENLCQETSITIDEPTKELTLNYPAKSLSTFIFTIQNAGTAISEVKPAESSGMKTYYDLHGRRLSSPSGLCIERSADGSARKVIIR